MNFKEYNLHCFTKNYNDKRTKRVNIRITNKQDNFMTIFNLSPTKIFDKAIEEIMKKEGVK